MARSAQGRTRLGGRLARRRSRRPRLRSSRAGDRARTTNRHTGATDPRDGYGPSRPSSLAPVSDVASDPEAWEVPSLGPRFDFASALVERQRVSDDPRVRRVVGGAAPFVAHPAMALV